MREEVSICVFAGHTGGHLFPALAFAERLKKRLPKSRITLITSPKAKPIIEPLAARTLDQIEYLNEFPFFSGISLRTLHFLLEFLRAFLISSQKLARIKPDLCVGFGSYVSYPGMKLAGWKKIPTMIHEQNRIAGKATKMLAGDADIVAVSFPETRYVESAKRLELTGLPVRFKLYSEAQGFRRGFESVTEQKPLKIFITGGSQGAHKLNKVILESFFRLSPEERKKIAVTHITGTKDFEWVKGEYEKMDINMKVYPFYEKMQELYAGSDFAVTRAGANTLFELALFSLPAVAVPFPYAAEDHQDVNARYFESQSAIRVEKETTLTPEGLGTIIRDMMRPEVRHAYAQELRRIAPLDAAETLADLAFELLSKGSTRK